MSTDEQQDLNKRLDKQDEMLRQIHTALVGDEMGNPGLVRRVGALEKEQEAQKHKLIYWAGIVAGVSVVLSWLKSKIIGG